ncbi:MAG: CoA pyrophosphatase [Chloroflexi bacterium]|nr:CoA pyrophosphatase [Chloroflexota bacterium]
MLYAPHPLIQRLRDTLAVREKQTLDGAGLKPSAVLVLVYPRDGQHVVLLTKRTSRVDDHKGEISFPGGAFSPEEDPSLRHTALRESAEEVGLELEYAEVLGELDDTPTRSSYLISPFVGTLLRPQRFKPHPAEVAELLEIPLPMLLDPRTLRSEPVTYAGREVSGFYYQYQEHVIFGATARILQQFLHLLPPLSA